MTLIEKIVASKHCEVNKQKNMVPATELLKSIHFKREALPLSHSILKESSGGIIAEFKRMSPSAGILQNDLSPADVASGYFSAGAAAVSILTDPEFFGGTINDLEEVRRAVNCPVLRKDFIIDEYQVIEARAYGADAILLICEVLSPGELSLLHGLATSIGMEVIVEIHDKKNLDSIPACTRIAGINNRNLSTLDVSLHNSEELISMLPDEIVKVAESGIRSAADYMKMKKAGFDGFLIGECFMKNSDPALACKKFIHEISGS